MQGVHRVGCRFAAVVAFSVSALAVEAAEPAAKPAMAGAAPAIPETTAIYDPAGGPDQRNAFRPDLAQCSLWYGGPAGTLTPAGAQQPAVPPMAGLHGRLAAGFSSACGRWEGLAQASAFMQGAFVRGMIYRERAGGYDEPAGSKIAYGYSRQALSAGFGLAGPNGSFIAFDVTRGDKSDVRYAGAPIDTRYFDATTYQLRSRLALEHPILKAFRFSASWTDFDRLNDNFSYRPLVGAATLARFDRKVGTLDAALDGKSGALDWTLAFTVRHDQRDATRFQGPALAAQSPVIADGSVTSYGVTAEGAYALAPTSRIKAGARIDFVQASLGGMDRAGLVTPGFGPTPTPRSLFAATYGYAGSGSEQEVNVGGHLRYEQDFDQARGRWFAGAKRVVRTADPRERYFVSFTPPSGGALNPGPIHRTWIGNPGLKPEQHHVAELGAGWSGNGWELAGRGYADWVSDFILWDRARGQAGVRRADNINIFRNVDAVIAGLEGSAKYRFANGFWLGATGWLTYGENLTDGRALAQIPPLEAQLKAGWSNGTFDVETRWRLVSRQFRVDGLFRTGSGTDGMGFSIPQAKTPGFATLDMAVGWNPAKNVRFTLGVENLFDKRYREHIERTDIDDPFTFNPTAAGRSIYGRMQVQF